MGAVRENMCPLGYGKGGGAVDPVSLIVAALAAGAGSAVQDGASAAVKGAYARLRDAVRGRLAGRADGAVVLARHGNDPQVWEAPGKPRRFRTAETVFS